MIFMIVIVGRPSGRHVGLKPDLQITWPPITDHWSGIRNTYLVFYSCDNYGFSVPVVIHSKARLAVGVDKLTELAITTWIEH